MRKPVGKKLVLVASVLLVFFVSMVYSHCQIPCGIYGDRIRFDMLAEHITTIEKSMKLIAALSKEDDPDMNQIVRWVQNKEKHADEMSQIITQYFMAQRIKLPAEGDLQAHDEYVKKLTRLHQMLVYSMKAKQTTDLSTVEKLRSLLAEFHQAYFGKSLPR
jgi:nickel superoxide dismutase